MVSLGKPVIHTMEHKHLAIHVGKKTGATTLLYNFWNKWLISLSFLKEAGQHIQIPRAREPTCQQEADTWKEESTLHKTKALQVSQ